MILLLGITIWDHENSALQVFCSDPTYFWFQASLRVRIGPLLK